MRVVLVLAALLVGCGPAEPWVEVGTGTAGVFESIDDGDVLLAEAGSQGGRHVWVGMRADGVEPGSVSDADAMRYGDRPRVDFRLEGPDGVYSLDVARYVALDERGGALASTGWLLPLRLYAELPEGWQSTDWAAVQEDLEERPFDLVVTLKDADGIALEDRRSVFIDFP